MKNNLHIFSENKLSFLVERIVEFCEVRDWKQFHNPKDLAISLMLEAGEVLEHFQWKNNEEIEKHIKNNKNDIGEELADVLYWVLLMSYYLNIDILDSLERKISKNEEKYPVEKAKGRADKYTNL
jgi:NTP pyrophosphatase (non-canonical NTP hydrolase)